MTQILIFAAVVIAVIVGLYLFLRNRKKGHTPGARIRGWREVYGPDGMPIDYKPGDRIDYSSPNAKGPTSEEKDAKAGK